MKFLAPLWLAWKTSFRQQNPFSFELFSPTNQLDLLAEKHGTDKGGRKRPVLNPDRERHNYAQLYDFLFSARRMQVRYVFECGIGSKNQSIPGNMGPEAIEGASLRVWRDYFPNAEIVGVDIDKECLFQENRISTHQCDQTDESQVRSLFESLGSKYDLIVDDGMHSFEANLAFFMVANHFLREGGYHIIEDVHINEVSKWKELAEKDEYLRSLGVAFALLRKPGGLRADNNLVIFGPSGGPV